MDSDKLCVLGSQITKAATTAILPDWRYQFDDGVDMVKLKRRTRASVHVIVSFCAFALLAFLLLPPASAQIARADWPEFHYGNNRPGVNPYDFFSNPSNGAELRVAVEDQEALRLLAVFPRFAQLQDNPERVGITRYVVVKDSTTVVADDEKAVENAESKRGYGEEVHRGNGLAMVLQERQPALRRVWSSGRSPKPSRDRRL